MYKKCKTQQSSNRQWEIAQCIIRMMQTCAYQDITVSALCREAGIQRRVFYRYFDNVDDVFQLMVDHMLVEYADFAVPVSGAREGSSQRDMEKFFSFWMQKKDWMDALARNQMFGILVSRIIASSCDGMLDIHWEEKLTSQELEFVSAYVLSGLFAMLQVWYLQGFAWPVEKVAALAVDRMTKPLYCARP